MIIIIQIIGVLFGLFMLYITFIHRKRKEFTSKEALFWLIVWLGFILISAAPTALDYFIREVINFNRRLDFFIVVGFLFVFGVVFYLYTLVRKLQKKLEEVVRKVAIDHAKE